MHSSSDYRNNPIAKTSSKKQEEVSKNQAKKGTVKQELEKEATKERAKSKQKNKFVPSELFSQKDYDHIKSLMDQESQTLTEEQLDEYDLQQFEAMEKEMNKKKKK